MFILKMQQEKSSRTQCMVYIYIFIHLLIYHIKNPADSCKESIMDSHGNLMEFPSSPNISLVPKNGGILTFFQLYGYGVCKVHKISHGFPMGNSILWDRSTIISPFPQTVQVWCLGRSLGRWFQNLRGANFLAKKKSWRVLVGTFGALASGEPRKSPTMLVV